MDFIKKHVKLAAPLIAALIFLSWYLVKRENDYHTHLNRINKKYIREMQQKHGFICCGIGGSLAGSIKKVSLHFYCFEKKSIEEARLLELECIERFCEMINSNEKIRCYLEKYPFKKERVGILICFCNRDLTSFPPEESISLVLSCKEKLFYTIEYNDNRPNQTILEETFTEAYEKADRVSIEQAKRGFK